MTFALERKLNLEISNKNVKRRGFRIQIKCYFEVLYHLELNFFIKIQQDFLCAYRSFYNHLIRGSVLNEKQAENGLQSRSSENGRTAVWHYGLILHGFGIIWYGLVWHGMAWYGLL